MRWGSGDVYTGGGGNSGLESSWGRGLLALTGWGRIGSGSGYNCMLYYQYTGWGCFLLGCWLAWRRAFRIVSMRGRGSWKLSTTISETTFVYMVYSTCHSVKYSFIVKRDIYPEIKFLLRSYLSLFTWFTLFSVCRCILRENK